MMNKKSLIICIGNNDTNLMGCENDALLFFNFNFSHSTYLLINNNATFENIKKIFKQKKYYNQILIFFSGHGLIGGNLKLFDRILKPIELYDLINSIFYHPIDLYLILDCCYSGSFPQLKNFNKINNTFIFSSCTNNQKSTESIVLYDETLFKNHKPDSLINKSIVVGTFTYHLIRLVQNKEMNNFVDWFNLDNETIWKQLEGLTLQKISIKK